MESEREFDRASTQPESSLDTSMSSSRCGMNPHTTPFTYKMSNIDKKQSFDQEAFFEDLNELFGEVLKLSTPIIFEKSEKTYGNIAYKPLLMLFGEMGNGKSSTGNFIIKEELKKTKGKFKESLAFKASQSVTAVTKVMKIKNFKNISILDSPGFNDPDKTRSDA